MFDQKEAYQYKNYMTNLEGSSLKVVPFVRYVRAYSLRKMTPYRTAETMAEMFKEAVKMPGNQSDPDDLSAQKIDLAEDKTSLILGSINARDQIKYDNLASLYDDLIRVSCWRLERSFPDNYLQDRTWSDLNKMELSIRDQIRRELKDAAKDEAFPGKDLRESLLEFKIQSQKANMLNDDSLESKVEGGVMEQDSSYQIPGDLNQSKTNY